MPKDSIKIIDGQVFINGKPNENEQIQEYISDGKKAIEFEETLPNGKKIRIMRYKDFEFPDEHTIEKKYIPENEYFLMGDSRDNAYDSRFFGTIKKQDILGKGIYTYWGKTKNRINVDLR